MTIDVSGLERLLGPARTIGEELRRDAAARGVRAHVAVAGTRMAARLFALARPGLTVIASGDEAQALATLPLTLLEKIPDDQPRSSLSTQRYLDQKHSAVSALSAVKRRGAKTSDFPLQTFSSWGIRTLGELASLPPADLVARFGRGSVTWQAIARGEDVRPLVPTLAEERFESTFDLEWPIDGLEPLSFILTRLLEPLSLRLERRDRGAAVLHVLLGLVTHESYARRLQLPSPLRDVRTLRTLALLDLDSHPPPAAFDRVTIVIDPTPGRVLQHTLYTRAHPTPDQLSTLLARLGALMGQDRLGAPAMVDSHRPGAFAMEAFKTDHDTTVERRDRKAKALRHTYEPLALSPKPFVLDFEPCLVSALRRCRQPVPARVTMAGGRPVRVTTDRRGFTGGAVVAGAGPWRTSGNWWNTATVSKSEVRSQKSGDAGARAHTSDFTLQTYAFWNRDEWDVSLSDGAVYRIFRDRDTDGWFIDAIVD